MVRLNSDNGAKPLMSLVNGEGAPAEENLRWRPKVDNGCEGWGKKSDKVLCILNVYEYWPEDEEGRGYTS